MMLKTKYRNAGRTKIDDRAMLWMLWAFVAYPYEAVRFQASAMRYEGLSMTESFEVVWPWLWRHNLEVWRSL
jgi:hypothetical protein